MRWPRRRWARAPVARRSSGARPRDYSFQYVVSHVSDAQPLLYDLTSFWGGMEGALLLWVLLLSGYQLLVLGPIRGDSRCVHRRRDG